jgi:hypothetical protein
MRQWLYACCGGEIVVVQSFPSTPPQLYLVLISSQARNLAVSTVKISIIHKYTTIYL